MTKAIRPPTPGVRFTRGLVNLLKGGTSNPDRARAIAAMNGLDSDFFDTPNRPASLDGLNITKEIQIPVQNVPEVTLSGLKYLFTNQQAVYKITNYDSGKTYNVSLTNHAEFNSDIPCLVDKDTITFTAPALAATLEFKINTRSIWLEVKQPWPNVPLIGGNANTGTVSYGIGSFNTSEFSMVTGDFTHQSTDWQIATDINFNNIIARRDYDTINKTSWSYDTLPLNSTFYVRARHRASNTITSDWSNVLTLVTNNHYQPTVEEAKLIASDKASSDMFGCSVAMDLTGTRVVVGAYQDDYISGRSNTGSAYVFVRSGTSWVQEGKLVTTGVSANNEYFGFSVSIDDSGTRCVVGSYQSDYLSVSNGGEAVVYVRSGSTWSREARLVSSDRQSNDILGWSVVIDGSGTRVAAGAPQEDTSKSNAGTVYVWVRSGSSWTQEQKIQPTTTIKDNLFGFSVDITNDGTRLIIGACPISGTGNCYVFLRSGSNWVEEDILITSDRSAGDRLGIAVAISSNGDIAVVSASNAGSSTVSNCGAVYVFRRNGSIWTQEAKLTALDPVVNSKFGLAISIVNDGVRLTIGAPFVSGTSYSGFGYLFFQSGSLWIQEFKYIPSDGQAGDCFGYGCSIAGDGTRAIFGSYLEDPSSLTNAGSAYVYS